MLADELTAIRERRRRIGMESSPADPESPGVVVAPPDAEQPSLPFNPSEQQIRREALDANLVGLAFSGGGIRSATFNLGVIQGLADAGFLTRFDYLSTVSGGGYIGSWLAAWIKREGNARNVECQLNSCRTMQARAHRQGVPQGEVLDAEPEPIHHLRAFSSYLTPVRGLFSVDAWVLASIYIRNLLLNLLVLVPFLLALIMSERLLILTFIWTTDLVDAGPWELGVWFSGLGLFLAMLVSIFMWIRRSLMQIRDGLRGAGRPYDYHRERRYLHRCILIPLLTLSVLSVWLAFGHAQFRTGGVAATYPMLQSLVTRFPWLTSEWFPYAFSGFTMAIVVGTFHLISSFDHIPDSGRSSVLFPLGLRFLRFGLGLLIGLAAGMFLYALFEVLCFERDAGDRSYSALIALTFGPPSFLIALNLIAFLQVGLISRLWSESIREWWSSLCGSTMIYIACWLFVFGISIWGPWLILVLEQEIQWIDTALLTGWGTAMGGGIAALRSAATGGVFRRMFLKFLPYVFIVGLIILTSFLTDYFVPPSGRAATPGEYLQSVTRQNQDVLTTLPIVIAGLLAFTVFASTRIDVNSFGLHALYKNRLVRCYLGASRPKAAQADGSLRDRGAPTNVPPAHPRSPNPITGFDPCDDLPLSGMYVDGQGRNARRRQELTARIEDLETQLCRVGNWFILLRPFYRWRTRFQLAMLQHQLDRIPPDEDYVGPYHLICAALNLVHGGELAWQERKAESFALTPQYCGSATTGYSPTDEYAGGVTVGEAVAISGAAVSPNMGCHSGGPLTALLAIFNMRLGAWKGNPSRPAWRSHGPKHLLKYFIRELCGLTDTNHDYVYLSDGGHFENLGVYELLRRRCRYIVVCDSGADPNYAFQDLGGLIRKARIDFGIGIDIDGDSLRPKGDANRSQSHVAVGTIYYEDIRYCGGKTWESPRDASVHGVLIYLKPAITGGEPEDVLNYQCLSPEFPHEPTSEQWFSESQFESYRALGWHIAQSVFGSVAEEISSAADSMPTTERIFSILESRLRSRSAEGSSPD